MGRRIRVEGSLAKPKSLEPQANGVLKLEVFNLSLVSNVTAYYLPIYLLGMRALFEHKTLNMRKINHN